MKKYKFFIIFLVITMSTLSSCNHKMKKTKQELIILGNLERKNIQNNRNFKEMDCNQWKLKKKDVLDIFPELDSISSVEWNAICYTLPCYYEGKAIYNGVYFKMTINAGSFLILSNKNKTKYFINKKNNLKKYFTVSCDCCDVDASAN